MKKSPHRENGDIVLAVSALGHCKEPAVAREGHARLGVFGVLDVQGLLCGGGRRVQVQVRVQKRGQVLPSIRSRGGKGRGVSSVTGVRRRY
jgi:hypothetical protein